jgi:hypothetical protein
VAELMRKGTVLGGEKRIGGEKRTVPGDEKLAG